MKLSSRTHKSLGAKDNHVIGGESADIRIPISPLPAGEALDRLIFTKESNLNTLEKVTITRRAGTANRCQE